MAKVLAVLAALVLGAEAGLTANGGICADSDEGLCRMPEVAAKVAEEVAEAGNCTGTVAGTCPCWELDEYSTDEAAFDNLYSYSGGCATAAEAGCEPVTTATAHPDGLEADEDQHGRIRDLAEQVMTQTAMDAAFAAGCTSSAYDGPVMVTVSTEGTELADFPLASGQNWCGPWATRDDAKTCTKSIFDANGALFLIITGATNLAPLSFLLAAPLDADPQRARAAGGALIIIFFQCSLVGAYELLFSKKGDDELEDKEP